MVKEALSIMTKTVLIVEDNALVLEMYKSALQRLDIRVIEARRGEEALELAVQSPPDLVLLDILLPGVSGYDVLTKLRQLPGMAHVPVFAVTNAAASADEGKLKEAGFTGLIPKPINIQSFIDTVARRLT